MRTVDDPMGASLKSTLPLFIRRAPVFQSRESLVLCELWATMAPQFALPATQTVWRTASIAVLHLRQPTSRPKNEETNDIKETVNEKEATKTSNERRSMAKLKQKKTNKTVGVRMNEIVTKRTESESRARIRWVRYFRRRLTSGIQWRS